MQDSVFELERQRVQEIAQQYQATGYEVIVETQADQLPDFLQLHRPDIFARGQGETVIVEVKSRASLAKSADLQQLAQIIQQHPSWRFELVVTNASNEPLSIDEALNKQDVLNNFNKTQELLNAGFLEAALLFAWFTTEATIRLLADKEKILLRRHDPLYVLKQLATYGVIFGEEYNFLLQVLRIRNAAAHGFRAEGLTPDLAQKLEEMTKYLLETNSDPALAQ